MSTTRDAVNSKLFDGAVNIIRWLVSALPVHLELFGLVKYRYPHVESQ